MNDKHKNNNHHIDYRRLWGSHESGSDDLVANRHNSWCDTVVANLGTESGSGEVLQMDSFQMVATWQLGDTAPVCGIAPVSDMAADGCYVEHAPHNKIKLGEHHHEDVPVEKHGGLSVLIPPEHGVF